MPHPYFFSWVESPLLAASGLPVALEELTWLRGEGIDILLSLSEIPPQRSWIDEAGLMLVHVPIEDFEAPSPDQFDKCLAVIERARSNRMGVLIHCRAGKGRTGTVLAGYFVVQGMSSAEAIEHVRSLRSGSIETLEQERSIQELARRRTLK